MAECSKDGEVLKKIGEWALLGVPVVVRECPVCGEVTLWKILPKKRKKKVPAVA